MNLDQPINKREAVAPLRGYLHELAYAIYLFAEYDPASIQLEKGEDIRMVSNDNRVINIQLKYNLKTNEGLCDGFSKGYRQEINIILNYIARNVIDNEYNSVTRKIGLLSRHLHYGDKRKLFYKSYWKNITKL